MSATPVVSPCKFPIEHFINLTDDTTVSLPRRSIQRGIRDVVKKRVSELLERDIIEPSSSPSNASLVPVVKKVKVFVCILINDN